MASAGPIAQKARYFKDPRYINENPAAVSEKVVALFRSFLGGKAEITAASLRAVFDSWEVKDMASQVNLFLEVFTRGEKDEGGRPVLTLLAFNDFVQFFFTVKSTFSKFERNGSVHLAELETYLQLYEYSFDSKAMKKFLDFFDKDGSGTLELNEILILNVSLYNIEYMFLREDDGDGTLDAKELQALFRALHINMSIKEMSLMLDTVPSHMIRNINFEKFVSLMFHVEQELPALRARAREMSTANKVKSDFQKQVAQRSKKSLAEFDRLKKEAKSVADQIISTLKAGEKWEDPDFPASPASLYPFTPVRNKIVHSWKRPCQISANAQLFVDGVDQGDVIQGSLEDCYLLSSLALLASSGSSWIEELIIGAYPEYGFYQCRFFKNNQWMLVTVDDRIPVNDKGTIPFSRCFDKCEFWTPILEKGYAKLHGSYQSIETGSTADALVDLTGEISEVMTKIVDSDSLWEKLLGYDKAGYFLGCSLEEDVPPKAEHPEDNVHANEYGIIMNHAYSILQVVEVLGARLLRLRNPWGHYEWNGPWSDNAKEWTPEIMEYLDFQFSDDGTFFMEFSDFCTQFNRGLCLLVMNSQWDKRVIPGLEWIKGQSAGGCINHPTWMNNPQLKIQVPDRSLIFISLQQYDMRLHKKKFSEYPSSGIMVIARDQQDDYMQEHLESRSKISALSPYLNVRESTVSFKANASQPYTVVFTRFAPDIEGKFTATVCSESAPVHVVPLMSTKPKTSVKGEWLGATAGGCPNWLSWHKSPQYILHIPQTMEATITIVQERKQIMNFIGFHIYKANQFKKPVLDPEAYVFQCEYKNSATVSSTTKLDAGYYNIVAATFEPGYEGKFGLVVQGAGATISNPEPWFISSVSSRWELPHLAGGCSNAGNEDWVKNPKIYFTIGQPMSVGIILEINQNSPIRGIGFYLLHSDDSRQTGLLLGKSSFKTEKEDFELEAGSYIIIPATYNKGIEGHLDVFVYSNKSTILLHKL